MFIKIENDMGWKLGKIELYETDEDGFDTIAVGESSKNISVKDIDCDSITIKIKQKDCFDTRNHSDVTDIPKECRQLIKELNSYMFLLRYYYKKDYTDCFIMIQNYFGHIDYGEEFGYFKTHDEICQILLKNLLYSLSDYGYEDISRQEAFSDFCNRQINKIIYNLREEHDFKVNRKMINKIINGEKNEMP